VFAADGTLFFTVQNANLVGRLVPKTGKVTLKEVPTPGARPYGIIVGPDGAAYFCEFGRNKIGRIDPKTLEVTEIALPDGARPRRIANNADHRKGSRTQICQTSPASERSSPSVRASKAPYMTAESVLTRNSSRCIN
jgi:streptogramin lyase